VDHAEWYNPVLSFAIIAGFTTQITRRRVDNRRHNQSELLDPESGAQQQAVPSGYHAQNRAGVVPVRASASPLYRRAGLGAAPPIECRTPVRDP